MRDVSYNELFHDGILARLEFDDLKWVRLIGETAKDGGTEPVSNKKGNKQDYNDSDDDDDADSDGNRSRDGGFISHDVSDHEVGEAAVAVVFNQRDLLKRIVNRLRGRTGEFSRKGYFLLYRFLVDGGFDFVSEAGEEYAIPCLRALIVGGDLTMISKSIAAHFDHNKRPSNKWTYRRELLRTCFVYDRMDIFVALSGMFVFPERVLGRLLHTLKEGSGILRGHPSWLVTNRHRIGKCCEMLSNANSVYMGPGMCDGIIRYGIIEIVGYCTVEKSWMLDFALTMTDRFKAALEEARRSNPEVAKFIEEHFASVYEGYRNVPFF